MNKLESYTGEVIHAVQDLLDISHGDASGIVECNSFYVMQGFTANICAADIAKKITNKH